MATTDNTFLYFQYLPQYKVLFCSATSCQYCLLPGKTLERHLTRQHNIKGLQKKQLLAWIETLSLVEADKLRLPAIDSPPIPELPIHDGFACTIGGFESCTELSASLCICDARKRVFFSFAPIMTPVQSRVTLPHYPSTS